MAEAKPEQEPSIEQILESIRQIISEDGEPAPQASAAAEPVAAPARNEERIMAVAAEANEGDDQELVVLDLVDIVQDEIEQPEEIIQETKEEPFTMAIENTPIDNSDVLLSDTTENTVTDVMAKLLAGNFAVERELPGRVGNVTLEDMARDLMRPLVKAWLDQNLPGIVEKLVAREIERVSKRAFDR